MPATTAPCLPNQENKNPEKADKLPPHVSLHPSNNPEEWKVLSETPDYMQEKWDPECRKRFYPAIKKAVIDSLEGLDAVLLNNPAQTALGKHRIEQALKHIYGVRNVTNMFTKTTKVVAYEPKSMRPENLKIIKKQGFICITYSEIIEGL